MNRYKLLLLSLLVFSSCKTLEKDPTFTIAFGSCDNQLLDNRLWDDISVHRPDVWIWGGDIIYSDTEDMEFMQKNYTKQKNNPDYANFIKDTEVMGTWDDHDYGLNDGGIEYSKKAEVQQFLLDFLDVPKNDPRRNQEGVYFAKEYHINEQSIKIIILDTRYFRTALTPDNETNKRYKQNKYGDGSMLGEAQWTWLKNEFNNSKSDFNIVMSSIQFLSYEHGFESWGNMPHEVERFENLIRSVKAKNTIVLSGDRHISEFSKKEVMGLDYPLIDFTSSGLTHSYTSYKSEKNKFRVGNVVPKISFGLLHIDLKTQTVKMEIRGDDNVVYESITQQYQ